MKFLAIAVMVLLVGCDDGDKKAAAPTGPKTDSQRLLDQMRTFKDVACACKDKVCAEKAQQDLRDWSMANLEMMKNIRATKAEEDEGVRLGTELQACVRRFSE